MSNIKPISGHVYYLKDFTAPKVFNGLYFECLLTEQKIRSDEKIKSDLGLFTEWNTPIYKPERFQQNKVSDVSAEDKAEFIAEIINNYHYRKATHKPVAYKEYQKRHEEVLTEVYEKFITPIVNERKDNIGISDAIERANELT